MPIRRSNPFDEIEDLVDRVSRELETEPLGRTAIPVDVEDRGGEYVVRADLPGFERGDIAVTLVDGSLRIEAEREASVEEESGDYIRRERSHGSTSRTVRLPEAIAEDGVEATYGTGVLTVTLPKRDAGDGGREIEIE